MSDLPPPPPGGPLPPPPPASDGGAPPDSPPPGPVAPDAPRGGRGRAVIVVVAALVVLAGLFVGGVLLFGGDDGGDVELSEEELADALLDAEEIDGEYTASDAESSDFDADSTEASEECEELQTEVDPDRAHPGRDFAPADRANPTITEELVGPYDGRRDFSAADELIDACTEMHFDDGEQSYDLLLSEADDLDLDLGDDTVPVKVQVVFTEPAEVTVDAYLIFWDRDGIYGTLEVFGGLTQEGETVEATALDTEFVEEVATAADEKLAEAIDDAD